MKLHSFLGFARLYTSLPQLEPKAKPTSMPSEAETPMLLREL